MRLPITIAFALPFLTTPALAHTGAGHAFGFEAGLVHPILGLDHALAMVGVGIWAALAGGTARWAWPAAFVAATVLASLAGLLGIPVFGVEAGIALSVVVLGFAIAIRPTLPVMGGAALVGLLALAHGYAHGAEIPAGAEAASYLAGFGFATMLLHAAGCATGILFSRFDRAWVPRLTGGAMAAAGLVFMLT